MVSHPRASLPRNVVLMAFLWASGTGAFAQEPLPQDLERFTSRETISLEFYRAIEGPEYDRAQRLFGESKYREAAEAFEQIFDKTKQPIALFLAGNCFYRIDAFDRAVDYYKRAIDSGLQAMPDAHYNLANAYYSKYRRAEAIASFEKVLELTGGADAMAHYHLGIILDGEGRHAEAIEHYRRTVELTNDGEPMAHQHLGVSMFMKKDFAGAVKALEIYVKQVHDDPGGYLNLGIALRYAGQLPRAIEVLHAAIRRSQDNLPDAHYQLARAYTEVPDLALALKHFEIARARGIRSPKTDEEFRQLQDKIKRGK